VIEDSLFWQENLPFWLENFHSSVKNVCSAWNELPSWLQYLRQK
jgi:hypothetical protein